MRRLTVVALLIGLCAWGLGLGVAAADTCPGLNPSRFYAPTGYEAVTVADSAIGLTANLLGVMAWITVEDGPIRVRFDGTAPTSSEGHKLGDGASFVLCSHSALNNFKAIRTSGTSGHLRVSYFKQE